MDVILGIGGMVLSWLIFAAVCAGFHFAGAWGVGGVLSIFTRKHRLVRRRLGLVIWNAAFIVLAVWVFSSGWLVYDPTDAPSPVPMVICFIIVGASVWQSAGREEQEKQEAIAGAFGEPESDLDFTENQTESELA